MNILARLVGEIGTNDFDQQFYDLSREIHNVNQRTVFPFADGEQPECLLAKANHGQSRSLIRGIAQDFTREGYQRDPQSERHRIDDVLWRSPGRTLRVTQLCPRRGFPSPLLRRSAGTLGTGPDRPDQRPDPLLQFLSQRRKGGLRQRRYSATASARGFPGPTLGKHAEVISMRQSQQAHRPEPATLCPERRERTYLDLRATLVNAPGGLTQREAEICASIALGFTTLGIGLKLGISINTVVTHRKRA